MQASPAGEDLAFAGFRLEPARRRLTGPDGAEIPLQPRVFDLLMLFLARPGELLGKQEIMDAIWPDTTVDENNLNQAVSALRRILGDSAGQPRMIATVPKRGYQFIAPVRAEGAAPGAALPVSGAAEWLRLPAARWAALAGALAALVVIAWAGAARLTPVDPPEASIAVLPFEDISGAGDQAYLADGVAEAIMNGLARLDGLQVSGRLSSAAAAERNPDPRAIGRTLDVAYVLSGGVRRDGDRLRITAELVDTEDGYRVWTRTYDRAPHDIFAIEDEIAASVTEALSLTLGVAPPRGQYETQSADAYDHYLRGRAYLAQSGVAMLRAAVEEFREATTIDPGYGSAWVSMARAADMLEVEDPDMAAAHRETQREAVEMAAAAAPNRWETIAVRARLLMRQRRWAEAERTLELARGVSPPTPVDAAEIEGVFLTHTGRPQEALPLFREARQSDPLNFSMSAWLAWTLDMTGDHDAALAEYAHARTLPGDETAWAFQHLVRLLEQGDARAINAYLANYPYTEDGTGAMLRYLSDAWRSPSDMLALLWLTLDPGTIEGPHRLDAMALLAAHYGDEELALRLFREEFFTRNGANTVHLWNPAMADVRRTDGFKTLVRDLGLVRYWRETGAWPDFCHPVSDTDFTCE